MASPEPHAGPSLELRLFGHFDARVDGRSIAPFRSRKDAWLLALLALASGRSVDRGWLASQLWPASDRSLTWLTQALSRVHRMLGPEASRLERIGATHLRLDLSGADVDLVAFDRGLRDGSPSALEAAVRCYAGPLLADCAEEWVHPERVAREQAYSSALERLATYRMCDNAPREAVRLLRLAVAIDPLSESAASTLMRALAATGDISSACQAYRDLRRSLLDQNLPISDATVALYNGLREADRMRPPSALLGAGRAPTSDPAESLPIPLTELIGRDGDIEGIAEHLRRKRLVTLTGPGGVGKTRLAVAVARMMASDFVDGAAMVELDALSDPALVARTLAAVANPHAAEQTDTLPALTARLRARHVLLVLDNCEHVLAECTRLVGHLLSHCGRLRVLATSRQPLGIPGEVVWRVPPLPLPPCDEASTTDDTGDRGGPAFRLFVERAEAAQPQFRVTEDGARDVARVCRLVDGLPLAIELAAAQVRAQSVAQIADALEGRLAEPEGYAGLPERHRTVGACIGWSHDLLRGAEQAFFRRLAVFAGGCTVEAATQVCCWGDLRSRDARPLLMALVDRSLLLFDAGAHEPRFRCLRTIAQYAEDRLASSPDEREARVRHLAWCRSLMAQASEHWRAPGQREWLARIETDLDNVRAALAWCLTAEGDVRGALGLAEMVRPFWSIRGHVDEGRRFYEGALAMARDREDADSMADALLGLGHLAAAQGDARARIAFEECLGLCERRGDGQRSAEVRMFIARIAESQGEHGLARTHAERALEVFKRLADRAGEAMVYNHLGSLAYYGGDYAECCRLHEDAARIYAALGDRQAEATALLNVGRAKIAQGSDEAGWALCSRGIAMFREAGAPARAGTWLNIMGDVARSVGDLAKAHHLYGEGLAEYRAQADDRGEAWSLCNLGNVARDQGRLDASVELYLASLDLRLHLRDLRGIVDSLDAIASRAALASRTGDQAGREWAALGARLFAAADVLRETIRTPVHFSHRPEHEGYVGILRDALGIGFDAEWAEGRSWSMERAIEAAIRSGRLSVLPEP